MTPGQKIAAAIDRFVSACREVEKHQDPHQQRLVAVALTGKDVAMEGLAAVLDEALAGRGAAGEEGAALDGFTPWRPMSEASRDGATIRAWSLERKREAEVFWSEHYSIHGLGGCWVAIDGGLGQCGDLHLGGWLPIAATAPSEEPEPELPPAPPPPDPLREGLLALNEEWLRGVESRLGHLLPRSEYPGDGREALAIHRESKALRAVLALIGEAKEGRP